MKKDMRERFQEISEEAVSMSELFHQVGIEYIFQAYEPIAFERILRMKWEILSSEN